MTVVIIKYYMRHLQSYTYVTQYSSLRRYIWWFKYFRPLWHHIQKEYWISDLILCGSGLFWTLPSVHLLQETGFHYSWWWWYSLSRPFFSHSTNNHILRVYFPEIYNFSRVSVLCSGSCVLITKPSRPLFCDR